MELKQLQEWMRKENLPCDTETMQRFGLYASLLQEWNEKMNLTAIAEPSEIYEKHFQDCLLPLSYQKLSGRIADVGSGAGFPGMVWAIVSPECRFTLIEPTGKRCTFLAEVKTQLKLDNVEIINARAEDYAKEHRESFDTVTARAVAALPVLCELCIPLVKVSGIFLAMKGSQGKEEAQQAERVLKMLGCENSEIHEDRLSSGDERINLIFCKTKPTPGKYPRPYAQIKKKPL
ncbi:MAG: 16S rRNA (guanine(527)-N(7))-methyltransferase RsmG [Bulleidia sp.]|nr:16S rRNA (guanine(527)-N(7))-methyltransferase RsmG [Bulleidia sp.]